MAFKDFDKNVNAVRTSIEQFPVRVLPTEPVPKDPITRSVDIPEQCTAQDIADMIIAGVVPKDAQLTLKGYWDDYKMILAWYEDYETKEEFKARLKKYEEDLEEYNAYRAYMDSLQQKATTPTKELNAPSRISEALTNIYKQEEELKEALERLRKQKESIVDHLVKITKK